MIVRKRLAAPIACCLIATMLPFSAVTAEYGIPAGSGAVITAGQPLAVRAALGWDAEVSYEIADGSYVTVWDVAQAAPDGTMWYPAWLHRAVNSSSIRRPLLRSRRRNGSSPSLRLKVG